MRQGATHSKTLRMKYKLVGVIPDGIPTLDGGDYDTLDAASNALFAKFPLAHREPHFDHPCFTTNSQVFYQSQEGLETATGRIAHWTLHQVKETKLQQAPTWGLFGWWSQPVIPKFRLDLVATWWIFAFQYEPGRDEVKELKEKSALEKAEEKKDGLWEMIPYPKTESTNNLTSSLRKEKPLCATKEAIIENQLAAAAEGLHSLAGCVLFFSYAVSL